MSIHFDNTASLIGNSPMATANDPLRLVSPGTIFEVLLQDVNSRPINPDGPLDLRRDCPVCGQSYESGEMVLTLSCYAFAADTASSVARRESDKKIPLGHHACILPRLLTLLAGFQPEIRFVKAASEPLVPELYHEKP